MTVGSLFAGIGGFDLAAERAGLDVRWQVEIDDYATRTLEKHWPHVKRFRDARDCGAHNLESVDIICGGFPCQDISDAGLRAGIDGARSGLWREMARVCDELRPRYLIVENVSALLARGMGRVLGDLAAIGYDAEWECLPAAAVGADHVRERVWIVAYPGCRTREVIRFSQSHRVERESRRFPDRRAVVWELADKPQSCDMWASEPNVGRVAHGVPGRVDRLRGLGNAIVPQVAEWIFRRIVETHEQARNRIYSLPR